MCAQTGRARPVPARPPRVQALPCPPPLTLTARPLSCLFSCPRGAHWRIARGAQEARSQAGHRPDCWQRRRRARASRADDDAFQAVTAYSIVIAIGAWRFWGSAKVQRWVWVWKFGALDGVGREGLMRCAVWIWIWAGACRRVQLVHAGKPCPGWFRAQRSFQSSCSKGVRNGLERRACGAAIEGRRERMSIALRGSCRTSSTSSCVHYALWIGWER